MEVGRHRISSPQGGGLLYVAIGLWAVVFLAASYSWRFGLYYDYGWFVPPLAMLLCYRNLRELPTVGDGSKGAGACWVLLIALAPVWAAARLLSMADPAWRLPQWGLAGLALAVTLMGVWQRKGKAGVRSFLPIAAFTLTAVPLPSVLEQALIHRLSGLVIEMAALVFELMGRPVQVIGQTMVSMGVRVEVGDDCSGIRSLQGFLMVGLFFGEWLRLRLPGRVVLLVLALCFVWLANVCRAVGLAWLRFDHGEAAFLRWHDTAGLLAFFTGALAVYALSIRLEPEQRWAPAEKESGAGEAGGGTVRGNLPALGAAGLVAVIEVAAWIWMHPPPPHDRTLLSLSHPFPGQAEPSDRGGFEKVRRTLRCNDGWLAAQDVGRRRLRAGWFCWDDTDMGSVLEVFRHSPEVCMGNIGWKLVEKRPARIHPWAGGELSFEVTIFEDPGSKSPLYVFKAVWIGDQGELYLKKGVPGLVFSDPLRQLCAAAVIHRFHPQNARVLMGVVEGEPDEQTAWTSFQRTVLAGITLTTISDGAAVP